jgi:Tfp pilus assembly protein FimT
VSTHRESSSKRGRTIIYIVSVLLLVVFVVTGLITFSGARQTAEADEKADELIAAIEEAGGTAPSHDRIVRVLGDDGGATCADPNHPLSRSILLGQLVNGAGGPGTRPVIVDSRVFQGQRLIIEVYCPDELEEFTEFVEGLETYETEGG